MEDENSESMEAKDEMEGVKDWAQENFEGMKNRFQKLQEEMRNNKPQENINVRKVDTSEGEKIVVEYSVQRWFSPKYFEKMLENTEENEDDDAVF